MSTAWRLVFTDKSVHPAPTCGPRPWADYGYAHGERDQSLAGASRRISNLESIGSYDSTRKTRRSGIKSFYYNRAITLG